MEYQIKEISERKVNIGWTLVEFEYNGEVREISINHFDYADATELDSNIQTRIQVEINMIENGDKNGK
jgi:hypothetical protein